MGGRRESGRGKFEERGRKGRGETDESRQKGGMREMSRETGGNAERREETKKTGKR